MDNFLFNLFIILFVLIFIGMTYLILKQPKKVSKHIYETRRASKADYKSMKRRKPKA